MRTRFAIDLLWFRYGKIGGGVAVALNLLQGFLCIQEPFELFLIVMEDQRQYFTDYLTDKRFHVITLEGDSSDRKHTVMLQNTRLAETLEKNGIQVCLEPDNYMPAIRRGKIKYVTVIHDLQAIHFPQNFSSMKRLWLKANWKNAVRHSARIISISDFTKKDIVDNFHIAPEKITTIYDPIHIEFSAIKGFEEVGNTYGIDDQNYLYTVGYLGPNKNLNVLVDMMGVLKDRGIRKKLVVSGLKGEAAEKEFYLLAEQKGVKEDVLLTGYVDNPTRNTLYRHCEAFLFPSVFEGFGMPPLEACCFGARVITTRESSLPEVTQNKLEYVNNPYDANEWADALLNGTMTGNSIDLQIYDPQRIAKQYLTVIKEVAR